MANIDLQGTRVGIALLPCEKKGWVTAEIAVKNEWVSYCERLTILQQETENCIFAMFRLLAGAYGREYCVNFESAGLAFDFYPYTQDGAEATREERRKNDCVMAMRLMLRGKNRRFLGGVFTFLLHRNEIEIFAKALREEYEKNYVQRVHGMGKYRFVGVSPLGYTGCNYWYLDPSNSVQPGEYVWARMGRHNTEQVLCVDSVRFFDDETAPYDPTTVRKVIRKATKKEWKDIE